MTAAWGQGAYTVDCDAARLDLDLIHGVLVEAYWSRGIPRETVARSIAGSLNFGLYHADDGQVGYARVVSDRATFAWLGDVFVLPAHRGRGLAAWLIECVMAHPELQGLRRWMLATRDAHGLYRRFGFQTPPNPESLMEIVDLDIYLRERR